MVQKLLYYAQGFYCAINDGNPLFEDQIMAWNYGPVIPAVYQEYKSNGSNRLPPVNDLDMELYDSSTIDLVKEIYDVYGKFAAFSLKEMTHNEKPWKDTLLNSEITLPFLKDYFKTRLN